MTDSTGAESWIADFTETAAELVAANDAAPVASVRLTDAEREAITGAVVSTIHGEFRHFHMGAAVEAVVEQILTDRLAPSIPSQRGPSDEKVES